MSDKPTFIEALADLARFDLARRRRDLEELAIPPGRATTPTPALPCDACEGTGSAPDGEPCPLCEGTGLLEHPIIAYALPRGEDGEILWSDVCSSVYRVLGGELARVRWTAAALGRAIGHRRGTGWHDVCSGRRQPHRAAQPLILLLWAYAQRVAAGDVHLGAELYLATCAPLRLHLELADLLSLPPRWRDHARAAAPEVMP